MRLFIASLLVLMSVSLAHGWGNVLTDTGVYCVSDSDILTSISFEDNSSPYTAEKVGTEEFTLNGAVAINGDIKIVGAYTLDMLTDEDYITMSSITDDVEIDFDSGRVGFYVNVTTWGDWANLFDTNNGTQSMSCTLRGSSGDGEIWCMYKGTNAEAQILTTTVNESTGNTFYVEYEYDRSTPAFEIFVDGVSKGTSTQNTATFSGDPTTLNIGYVNDAASADYAMDQFRISTNPDTDLYAIRNDKVCDD